MTARVLDAEYVEDMARLIVGKHPTMQCPLAAAMAVEWLMLLKGMALTPDGQGMLDSINAEAAEPFKQHAVLVLDNGRSAIGFDWGPAADNRSTSGDEITVSTDEMRAVLRTVEEIRQREPGIAAEEGLMSDYELRQHLKSEWPTMRRMARQEMGWREERRNRPGMTIGDRLRMHCQRLTADNVAMVRDLRWGTDIYRIRDEQEQ